MDLPRLLEKADLLDKWHIEKIRSISGAIGVRKRIGDQRIRPNGWFLREAGRGKGNLLGGATTHPEVHPELHTFEDQTVLLDMYSQALYKRAWHFPQETPGYSDAGGILGRR